MKISTMMVVTALGFTTLALLTYPTKGKSEVLTIPDFGEPKHPPIITAKALAPKIAPTNSYEGIKIVEALHPSWEVVANQAHLPCKISATNMDTLDYEDYWVEVNNGQVVAGPM